MMIVTGRFREVGPIVPVISTSAYAANDTIGTVQELKSAALADATPAILRRVTLLDEAAQAAAMQIWLFDSLPTAAADNAAFSISAVDLRNAIGFIAVATTDWGVGGHGDVAMLKPDIPFRTKRRGSIWMVIKNGSGTPTFVAATDLKLKFVFEQQN